MKAVVGDEVPAILSAGGSVEFKTPKAIYVRTSFDEVVILAGSPLTPYTVGLGECWRNAYSDVVEGDEVLLGDGVIFLGGKLPIPVGEVTVSGRMPCMGEPPLEIVQLARRIVEILDLRGYGWDGLDDARLALNSCEEVEKILERFVGLGPGATPAGDDFISGVILAHIALGRPIRAGRLVELASRSSRWPSWKMMEHASHGCTFSQLVSLYGVMIAGDLEGVTEWVVKTMRLGGCSGTALLAGFLETMVTAACREYPSGPSPTRRAGSNQPLRLQRPDA